MTVYYKIRQIILQTTTDILLQNTTELSYKMHQAFYYKIRVLSQNATILLQNASYYKMRRFLQIATVHTYIMYLIDTIVDPI